LLLRVFPETEGPAHMHVQGADDAELGNLNAEVEHLKVFNGNALLLLSKQYDCLLRELKLVEKFAIGSLLEATHLVPIGLLEL